MIQAAALASMESQLARQRAPTAGTCQTMHFSVVLGIVGLKASKLADSGAGCPKVEARFPSRAENLPVDTSRHQHRL